MTNYKNYIFYPLYGVGILDINEIHSFDNQTKKYYKINIIKKKLDIFIPVEDAADKGLRPLSTKSQWLKAHKQFFKNYICLPVDAKERRLLLQKKLSSGILSQQIEIIRDVSITDKLNFKLPIGDKDILKNACSMLADELMYIKNISYDIAFKEITLEIKKRLNADHLDKQFTTN
ncbi:CarD family transcriptional regulator [Paenibacillus jamilae]|uniref:CarD family transcriptional regulator n=1 Tax=Paenibacillus jamilae TaxID=114136 RepID=UPI003D2E04C1